MRPEEKEALRHKPMLELTPEEVGMMRPEDQRLVSNFKAEVAAKRRNKPQPAEGAKS